MSHLEPSETKSSSGRDGGGGGVEALDELLAEGALASLRAVAAELTVAVERAETFRGVDHAFDDGGGDGLGGVTDAEGDDLGVGVLREVRVLDAVDLGEEVASLELSHVGVAGHLGGGDNDSLAAAVGGGGGVAPEGRSGERGGGQRFSSRRSRHPRSIG